MRKLSKILFCLFIYMSFFVSAYSAAIENVYSEILSFSTNDPVIEGKTGRIGFSAIIRVTPSTVTKHQYLTIEEENISSRFLNVIDLKNKNGNHHINFKVNGNTAEESLELNLTGTLVFNWAEFNKNSQMQIKIGSIYVGVGNINKADKIGNVYINLGDYINIISSLKVNVKEHMDFGTIIAGQKADTSEPSRTPAKIEVEGTINRNVIIMIPETTDIKNESGDTLKVNLRFRNGEMTKREKSYLTVKKNLNQKSGKENIGITETVVINGALQTKQSSRGNYKGAFTVRVEYEY